MCTPFHNLTTLKHQDQVCISDYGQAMGDDESCAPLDDRIQGATDEVFRPCIDTGGRIIKNKDTGIDEQGTGDSQALLLAT
jgi:hypothetical protein